jgi:hypothetical protein
MVASNSSLERFIGELTDVAVELVLRARPQWNSIDVELAVGTQIDACVRREFRFQRVVGGPDRQRFQENFLGRLAVAVYQLGLRAGVRRSFLDLELGIWNTFRGIAERTAINQWAFAGGLA